MQQKIQINFLVFWIIEFQFVAVIASFYQENTSHRRSIC